MAAKYKSLIFSILLLLVANTSLWSQTYGKIVGIVTDALSDETLIGANVYLEGTSLGAATDLDGNYIILKVPPGKYRITVEYLGYQKLTYEEVQVLTDLTTTLNFEIKPEAIEGEEIVVIAEAPLIRKDLTSVESRIQAEDIERMAVQEVSDILSMQAGVVKGAGGEIHIRGGRASEVSYMVNGISITDDFERNQSFQVENESIQELQVISGTFNAEYGNAMSGIVNFVTKTGGEEFKGELDVWSGDYISGRDNRFWNIDDIDPFANYNVQGSVGGPIVPGKVSFFVTGRKYYHDGYLYGPKAYLPTGQESDSSAVPLSFNDRISLQTTISWNILNDLKFKMDFFGHIEERRSYDHFYRLNPTGDRGDKDQGYSVFGKFTHTLSPTTYHEFTVAFKSYEIKSNLYEDSLRIWQFEFDDQTGEITGNTPGYVPQEVFPTPGVNKFAIGGNDVDRFERTSESRILKWDLTSQVNRINQAKLGFELSLDQVSYFDGYVYSDPDSLANFVYQPRLGIDEDFTRKPIKAAAFIQDKIELEDLIVNVGLRYDYFDPKGKLPADPADPYIDNPLRLQNIYKDLNDDGTINPNERVDENKYTRAEREEFWYKKTKAKSLLSPRLGVAYPISNEGVLHFSFGIFQQIPEYSQLYIGDQIRLSAGSGNFGPFGNPDLEPQVTTMYELGLQQELSDNFSIDVTGFYRDIRDWVSTSQPYRTVVSGKNYVTYINRDFANVRGITLALNKRFSGNYAFSLDYTFQIAEGTNSDPTQEFNAQQGGAEPTKVLTPLDWDQRHTLNGNVFVGGQDWGIDLISRFNTGQPYTPTAIAGTRGSTTISSLLNNSRIKPVQFTVDLNSFYNFEYEGFGFQLYVKVFNLLDAGNPQNIWTDTGLANFTLTEQIAPPSTDPTWFTRPDYYSPPRRVTVGLKTSIY